MNSKIIAPLLNNLNPIQEQIKEFQKKYTTWDIVILNKEYDKNYFDLSHLEKISLKIREFWSFYQSNILIESTIETFSMSITIENKFHSIEKQLEEIKFCWLNKLAMEVKTLTVLKESVQDLDQLDDDELVKIFRRLNAVKQIVDSSLKRAPKQYFPQENVDSLLKNFQTLNAEKMLFELTHRLKDEQKMSKNTMVFALKNHKNEILNQVPILKNKLKRSEVFECILSSKHSVNFKEVTSNIYELLIEEDSQLPIYQEFLRFFKEPIATEFELSHTFKGISHICNLQCLYRLADEKKVSSLKQIIEKELKIVIPTLNSDDLDFENAKNLIENLLFSNLDLNVWRKDISALFLRILTIDKAQMAIDFGTTFGIKEIEFAGYVKLNASKLADLYPDVFLESESIENQTQIFLEEIFINIFKYPISNLQEVSLDSKQEDKYKELLVILHQGFEIPFEKTFLAYLKIKQNPDFKIAFKRLGINLIKQESLHHLVILISSILQELQPMFKIDPPSNSSRTKTKGLLKGLIDLFFQDSQDPVVRAKQLKNHLINLRRYIKEKTLDLPSEQSLFDYKSISLSAKHYLENVAIRAELLTSLHLLQEVEIDTSFMFIQQKIKEAEQKLELHLKVPFPLEEKIQFLTELNQLQKYLEEFKSEAIPKIPDENKMYAQSILQDLQDHMGFVFFTLVHHELKRVN